MLMNDIDKKPAIIVFSFVNGSIAMLIASAVFIPAVFIGLSITSGSFDSAINSIFTHWDVYLFIYFIGTLIEVSDRLYRGVKKNKIIKVIRDKEDRW